MNIAAIEPIRFTPFLSFDPRAAAATTYVPGRKFRQDESSLPGQVGEYPLLLPQQTHSTNVQWVSEETDLGCISHDTLAQTVAIFPDTDGLLTTRRGLAIGVRTADCLPVLLYARDIQAVGAVHAGWRGSLAGIAAKAVEMLLEKGAQPQEIFVRFGPHICHRCYEVDEALAAQFRDAGFADCVLPTPKFDPLTEEPFEASKPHIDLVRVNKVQMHRLGVPVANFFDSELCTRHTSLTMIADDGATTIYPYHSWRRNPGSEARNTTFSLLIPR